MEVGSMRLRAGDQCGLSQLGPRTRGMRSERSRCRAGSKDDTRAGLALPTTAKHPFDLVLTTLCSTGLLPSALMWKKSTPRI